MGLKVSVGRTAETEGEKKKGELAFWYNLATHAAH